MVQQPEYFILSAMNRKLQAFPDFATSIGMHTVTDCDSGRTFYKRYLDYFAAHPGFDARLPGPPASVGDVLAQQRREVRMNPPTSTVNKIFNGTNSGLFSAVKISHFVPGFVPFWDFSGTGSDSGTPCGRVGGCTFSCSGTFIAKNFILTAAHCLDDIALQFSPTSLSGWSWINSYTWTIRWVDSTGAFLARSLTTRLVSAADPGFVGVMNSQLAAAGDPNALPANKSPFAFPHDEALLYVDPEFNDGHLPADYLKNSLIYVSTIQPNLNWTLAAYGYGGTTEADNGNGQTSGVISSQFGVDTRRAGVGTISEIIPAGSFPFASLCAGDSGGPLVRTLPNGKLVIVGVNSGGTLPHTNCGDVAGQVNAWSRTDFSIDFITQTLQAFNGALFQPLPLPNGPGGSGNEYVSSQGSPCFTDCECDPSNYCSNPAVLNPSSPFRTGGDSCDRDVCGDGTCNCIVGQCLPRPQDFDGGDLSADGACE